LPPIIRWKPRNKPIAQKPAQRALALARVGMRSATWCKRGVAGARRSGRGHGGSRPRNHVFIHCWPGCPPERVLRPGAVSLACIVPREAIGRAGGMEPTPGP
jgi:hypothetical protein